jgi:hypothetical protein
MRKLLAPTAAVVFALLTAADAQAQTPVPSCTTTVGNLVKNCSFENPTVTTTGRLADYPDAPLDDWTANPDGVVERWSNGYDGFFAKDGATHVELKVNQTTTLSQYINTIAGGTYSLTFSAAHRKRPGVNNYSKIHVYIDDIFLFSTGKLEENFVWKNFLTSFDATSSQTKLSFVSMGSDPTYGDHLDNVSLVGPDPRQVPEPSSLALAVAGLAGLGVVARRRRA